MIKHSEKALENIDIFYADMNSIDIYVEDTDQGANKFYKLLFSRVFNKTHIIKKVFTLGGKKNVLKKHEDLKSDKSQKRLFVIDGDIDLFHNKNLTLNNQLLTLDKYCIENYLVDEEAIIDFVDDESSILDKTEIKELLNLKEWIDHNEPLLFELFKAFAICNKFSLPTATVSEGLKNLKKDGRGNICKEKIATKILEIKKICNENKISYEDEIEKYSNIIPSLDFVSAKDFLLPLIRIRISSFESVKINNSILKQKLARRCNLSALSELLISLNEV
jgi:hypothetical protein